MLDITNLFWLIVSCCEFVFEVRFLRLYQGLTYSTLGSFFWFPVIVGCKWFVFLGAHVSESFVVFSNVLFNEGTSGGVQRGNATFGSRRFGFGLGIILGLVVLEIYKGVELLLVLGIDSLGSECVRRFRGEFGAELVHLL